MEQHRSYIYWVKLLSVFGMGIGVQLSRLSIYFKLVAVNHITKKANSL